MLKGWCGKSLVCHLSVQHIHNYLPLTGNEYIVLGGQHFIKALKELRKFKLNEDSDESKLPKSLKVAEVEVLMQGADFGLRCFMAGQNQQRQSIARPCTLADFFTQVLNAAVLKKKAALAKSPKDFSADRCTFNPKETFALLERSGLKLDNYLGTQKAEPMVVPKNKQAAQEISKAKVCTQLCYRLR